MTEEIIIDGVNVLSCKYYLFRDKERIASDRSCGIGLTACKGKNCDFKEIANLKRENKEKIDIIEQMIKILYPNASDDELYDVAFNGEYIDKLKELKDTADTMLMANDIKKQDIDSLREANERLEQENEELKERFEKRGELMCNCAKQREKYRSALEKIREICKCSKSPINCDECPQNNDCEELCVNDENLQDIIYDKINEVLNESK